MINKTVKLLANHPLDARFSMHAYARLLCAELTAQNWRVEVAAPTAAMSKKFPGSRIRKPLIRLEKAIFAARIKRECNESRMLYHILDQGNARWALSAKKKLMLVTCHDLHVLDKDHSVAEYRWLSQYLHMRMASGIRNAFGLIAVSNFTASVARRILGADCPKLWVAPLCLHQEFYPETGASKSPLPDSRLSYGNYILNVGSNLSRKRRSLVFDIFKKMTNSEGLMVVFAGEPLNAELRQYAASLALTPRIVEIRDPDHNALLSLYRGAGALLMPSDYEGFGWPIIEAQAAGCPVVCSPHSSLPEVAGDKALICQTDTISEYAEKLETVIADLTERSENIKNGLKNVTRFSRAAFVAKYIEIYEECLAKN